jgi:hypothetical protein
MRTKIRRSILAALVAVVAVSSVGLTPAEARYRHHYGNAAGAAAFLGLVGTVVALAAADQYRDDYYGYGPYSGGYYSAPYGYYGGGYRHGGGYRYGGHWHHHH